MKTGRVNYIVARNKASGAIRKAKKEYEYRIAKEIKKNPTCFWNMVREKTKVKEVIQDLQAEDGSTASSDSDKAEILKKIILCFSLHKGKSDNCTSNR